MKSRYYIAMIFCILAQHFILLGFLPWSLKDMMVNVFGVASFAFIGAIVHYFIHNAVKEIRTLRGIIPICANCKKIRDDAGYWHQVESYVAARSDAKFSHGICPDCMQLLYPGLVEDANADRE
ncbi:MAG: hypothetical protein JXA41_14110 [Deltaproteobacteria bacterium]|nr:hypothetical protein [Deltaproteobacteria bacterium]